MEPIYDRNGEALVRASWKVENWWSYEIHDSWAEVLDCVRRWYECHLPDRWRPRGGLPECPSLEGIEEGDLVALNEAIAEWVSAIAEAMGYSDFHGHDRHHVLATSEAGLCLEVTGTISSQR